MLICTEPISISRAFSSLFTPVLQPTISLLSMLISASPLPLFPPSFLTAAPLPPFHFWFPWPAISLILLLFLLPRPALAASWHRSLHLHFHLHLCLSLSLQCRTKWGLTKGGKYVRLSNAQPQKYNHTKLYSNCIKSNEPSFCFYHQEFCVWLSLLSHFHAIIVGYSEDTPASHFLPKFKSWQLMATRCSHATHRAAISPTGNWLKFLALLHHILLPPIMPLVRGQAASTNLTCKFAHVTVWMLGVMYEAYP